MEKTKKKKNRFKRRIGTIALTGLGVVLAVGVGVGATAAWFAGSDWSSKTMFMGGPVYITMYGEGGSATGSFSTGTGNLDIHIGDDSRTTGITSVTGNNDSAILLPGQQLEVHAIAKIKSSAYVSTSAEGTDSNGNPNGTITGVENRATNALLRARFVIDLTLDENVGFAAFGDVFPTAPANGAIYTSTVNGREWVYNENAYGTGQGGWGYLTEQNEYYYPKVDAQDVENALNTSIIGLVNASATANYKWLYVTPSTITSDLGYDPNATAESTDVAGWWYLCTAASTTDTTLTNNAVAGSTMYEVQTGSTTTGYDGNAEDIAFVSGNFVLPGDEMTNFYGNAKISIKVVFQAIQAYLPNAEGIGQALTVSNAITIVYNEAFDYSTDSIAAPDNSSAGA